MKSASRALDIFEVLANRPGALEASTIARICRIPRSTVYPLLNTLTDRGFLTRNGDGRWSLGDRLREIGADAPSIQDGVVILEALDRSGTPVDVPELARRTGLHVTKLNASLAELVRESLVVACDDGLYVLGVRLAVLSAGFTPVEHLRTAARPVLRELRDVTGETANLLVRSSANVVYLEQARSHSSSRYGDWTGRRIPVSSSASGQALLTRRTVTVRDIVERGVTAVACAIGAVERPEAVLSVTGPSSHFKASRLDDLETSLATATLSVSRRLQAVP